MRRWVLSKKENLEKMAQKKRDSENKEGYKKFVQIFLKNLRIGEVKCFLSKK